MDEKELIYLLSNKDLILEGIQFTRNQIFSQLEEKNEMIKRLSLQGINYIDTISKGKKGDINHDQMFNLFESLQKHQAEQINFLKTELYKVAAEEECIQGVLRELYILKEPYRNILILLFIQKEKWVYLTDKYHCGKSKIARLRQEGLNLLLKNYNFKKEELMIEGENLLKEIRNALENEKNKEVYLEKDFNFISFRESMKKSG